MAEVRRVRAGENRDVIDASRPGPSRRPGDRAVTWLVVGFVCVAAAVLSFGIVRSRSELPPSEVNGPSGNTARPADHGFRVVRVLDGDTLIIMGEDDIELTLRLAGIDAPEKDQPFGNEASQFLENLLSEQVVHLDNVTREKYGRILAYAYVGSRRLDLEMVQNGWAWVYRDASSRVLRRAEAQARAKKVGLWASDSATPPWEWRKEGP